MYSSNFSFPKSPSFYNSRNKYFNQYNHKVHKTNAQIQNIANVQSNLNNYTNEYKNLSNLNKLNNFENTNNSENTNNFFESKLFEDRNIHNENKQTSNEFLFEILGIKIFFDDILLICILLFLYQEGINDEFLFIALILLLLS